MSTATAPAFAGQQVENLGRPVVAALCRVMQAVRNVPKAGYNQLQRYHYHRDADIAEAVGKALAEEGVILIPSLHEVRDLPTRQTRDGGQMFRCEVIVTYTAIHAESGDSISFNMAGAGEDTGDKALYKALTGASKYAMKKLFNIGESDDAENDSGHTTPPQPQSPQYQPPPQPRPVQQAAQAAQPPQLARAQADQRTRPAPPPETGDRPPIRIGVINQIEEKSNDKGPYRIVTCDTFTASCYRSNVHLQVGQQYRFGVRYKDAANGRTYINIDSAEPAAQMMETEPGDDEIPF